MFLRRNDYEQLVTERAEAKDGKVEAEREVVTLQRLIDGLRAKVAELEPDRIRREVLDRQLAVCQQNLDWLMAHVNRLEVERGLLLARVLDVHVPVPIIARDPHGPQAEAVGMGQPLREEDRAPDDDVGLAALAMMRGSLEDMGDDAAKALGISHDLMGHVKYA